MTNPDSEPEECAPLHPSDLGENELDLGKPDPPSPEEPGLVGPDGDGI